MFVRHAANESNWTLEPEGRSGQGVAGTEQGVAMGVCRTCGGRAGLLLSECDDCIRQHNEALRAASAAAAPQGPPMLAPTMIATGGEIIGYTAYRSLGIVRGLSVRSRGAFGNVAAGAEMVVGGRITALERLCEDARTAAFDQLRMNAAEMGADAVVGLRYDATEIAEGVTEVLCYGTAVMLRLPDGAVR